MDMRAACARPVAAYTMVPNALLRDGTLSPVAKACLLYMASHAPGWIVRRSQILEATGISIRTWNRAARELRARGALSTEAHGRPGYAGLRGKVIAADWSAWLDLEPDHPPHAAPESPPRNSKVPKFDGRERDPESDPKGIPTRIPKGSTKKRERLKEAAPVSEVTRAYLAWQAANRGEPYSAWLESDHYRTARQERADDA